MLIKNVGGVIFDFPNNLEKENYELAIAYLHGLRDAFYIDHSTQLVLIDWNIYNPSLDLHTFARVLFETTKSG